MGSLRQETEIVIIGAGPGGYVAALRAADLGHEVLLIEKRDKLGGVCLLEGCIPSKSLISAVELAESARAASQLGLTFKGLELDPVVLRQWTEKVVDSLSNGVRRLLKRRGVEVVKGHARFDSQSSLSIKDSDLSGIDFRHCIIATGSRINEIPLAYKLPVWSSEKALQLREIPQRLLVVGGGYIGLELGLVYAGLGSRVTLVEFFPRLLMGADVDLVEVVLRHCKRRFEALLLESKVTKITQQGSEFVVTVKHHGEITRTAYDQVLLAVGRKPNTDQLGLESIALKTNEQGIIEVDASGQTNVPHLYAIGDVTPGPMLAHKASREGKVVAEVIAGYPAAMDNRAIPAVVFTDPEIAWTGITEKEAKAVGRKVRVSKFPLSALGRARAMGRTDGLVKIISEPESELILGVGIVGPYASELIAEGTLALEMGAVLEELFTTIHPHPTISEAMMEAAEVAAGQAVHLDPPRNH